MRFHPVVSIFLGFFIFSIFLFISVDNLSSIFPYFIILSFIISGFIATYFAKGRKIRYSLYELIPVILACFYLKQEIWGLVALFIIPLGGLLGRITDKNTSWYYSFNPVISIIIGLIYSYFFSGILGAIMGLDNYPVDSTLLYFFIIAVFSNVIGGFITTFMAKEKKIQYAIYFGIILILINLLFRLHN